MKHYPSINYAFAPATYWSSDDPLAAILRNVKGENRRKMIRDYWAAGKLEALDEVLLQDELDDDARQRLERIDPSFMGGEYLPSYLPGEVDIARICLRSTTSDVISLRARPADAGIHYRVVDEYEESFNLPIPISAGPLTLAELIHQLDGADTPRGDLDGGLSLGFNEMNRDSSGRENLRHFTRISSTFYPQLREHYEQVFEEWAVEPVNAKDEQSLD